MKAKVVGCGLSGVTSAILLKEKGYDVTIYETRNHIAGNCYDSNVCGTLVHSYGPHIFHTDDEEVFKFLSRYTKWIPFELRPLGVTKIGTIPLPYSKKTIEAIGRELSQEEIIDIIFKDYSEKQWGVKFEKIPKSITNRIPKTKDHLNPTWFEGQKYQCIPEEGYTVMFENMLKNIPYKLNCTVDEWKNKKTDITVFTGKIDEYFNYCYGYLPYRTLDFKHFVTKNKFKNTCTYNQNNKETKFTRSYDHSYFTKNHKGLTVITEEYPRQWEEGDIPFYPIPWGTGLQIYEKYKELAKKEKDVIFIGRLATYTYLDMWMAVKQAIIKLKNVT